MTTFNFQKAPVTDDPNVLADWAEAQLENLVADLQAADLLELIIRYAAPTRPKAGNIIFPDGVKYDPGSGSRLYYYNGTTWVPVASLADIPSVDTSVFVLLAGNQTITGGFKVTPASLGNLSGAFTPNPALGNYQYGTNHGAITWGVPANDCAIDILITNDGSAGAVTFSGYTVNSNVGEALTTTNGHKFIISLRRINGISTYLIKALQ